VASPTTTMRVRLMELLSWMGSLVDPEPGLGIEEVQGFVCRTAASIVSPSFTVSTERRKRPD